MEHEIELSSFHCNAQTLAEIQNGESKEDSWKEEEAKKKGGKNRIIILFHGYQVH